MENRWIHTFCMVICVKVNITNLARIWPLLPGFSLWTTVTLWTHQVQNKMSFNKVNLISKRFLSNFHMEQLLCRYKCWLSVYHFPGACMFNPWFRQWIPYNLLQWNKDKHYYKGKLTHMRLLPSVGTGMRAGFFPHWIE